MSSQQDIYAAGSESRPPMLNKENYVSWSSHLLCYAKSRPNRKLIHNSIINGPYVRRMIPEPGDTNREVSVNETFHVQTDDELTEKELKQIEADDQAIHTILLGLPKYIYAAVDSSETTQEIWLRIQQMIKGSDIGIQEKKAKEDCHQSQVSKQFAARMESTSHHQDQPLFNQNYMQQPMPNPEDITDPTTAMNMALALMAKAFKLNYLTPTNNNQRISSNPCNRQIAQPRYLNGYNAVQNVGNQVAQNLRIQNVGNENGLTVVPRNGNQAGNGNLVAVRPEGNAAGHNGIQLQAEEFDLMAVAADLDEIEEVNANCILMANLQQASTSGTQTDKAPVYNSDRSAEKEVDELKAERLAKIQDPLALMANSNNPYASPAPHQDQSPFNQNYMQQPMPNPEDITDPTTAINMALSLMAKAFKLNYSTPTNNNQRISSNPRNRQIAQPGNPAGYNDVIGNQVIPNAAQNPRVQNVGNQNGLIDVQRNGIQNQIGNSKLVATRAEGNAAGPRRRDAAYLQTQLLIAQKEEAGIQLQVEEYDLIAAPADLDEIEEADGSAEEADASLAKHKILEMDIDRLMKAVVSQDIISVLQNASVVDTSDLQT
nr:integrase, catalytic region, zinc finger, CCHC-type, peptidase aspartic, catalytic [Tanacetum cinerariifolium]